MLIYRNRSYLYGLTQKVFEYLGHNGKDCFKRAICELRQGPLKKSYGWVKTGLEWILTYVHIYTHLPLKFIPIRLRLNNRLH